MILAKPERVTSQQASDKKYMRLAIARARPMLGETESNPAVGCVIVRGDKILARAHTAFSGRPHAETEALTQAGDARGATAYVSLEPCAHTGKTPPCARALIEAGIKRVVAPIQDPDPRVNGRGFQMLREAGVEVSTGVLADEAEDSLAGYLMHRRQGRPLVTLKLAVSLDGKIAAPSGDSRWITSEDARERVQLLRAESDAIIIGVRTALADDPLLTCRLPRKQNPARFIADGRLALPLTSQLVRTARDAPLYILTRPAAPRERAHAFTQCGAHILPVTFLEDGLMDIPAALAALGEMGMTSLLLEGGQRLAASFLRAGMIDRLAWFVAPVILGARGLDAIGGLDVSSVADGFRFDFTHPPERIGVDVLLHARGYPRPKDGEK